jgi:predicted DsbA family dithiol-disulfide isomerase
MMTHTLTIDVYADIVCPWCYIGVKRLEKALSQKPELRVSRRWRPFQLRPEMPKGGLEWRSFAKSKFGDWNHALAAFAHVAEIGKGEGLDFRFDRVMSAPNTEDAHRLILLAREHGLEWEAAEAFFKAYFTDGRNLNSLEDLLKIAGGVGLDEDVVKLYLQGDKNRQAVRESQRVAEHYGISGVPFYVLDNKYGLSGAQPVEVLLSVFAEIEAVPS